MEQKNKNAIIYSLVALTIVLIGVTYGYFSARIIGLESASTISLTAGRMIINYSEGDEAVTASNIYPREEEWLTKTITLTGWNDTTLEMGYELGLNIATNTFPNNYLTYNLTLLSSNNGTPIASVTNKPINGTGKVIFGKGSFTNANGSSHSYELKIYFKDNGTNQNDAQRAVLNASVYASYAIVSPNGWSTASSGTLLSGIKNNNPAAVTPLTTPGVESSASNESVLASAEDDYGVSFYYRGAVENNYVAFAGMCWRIVRVVGDGSIKLALYNYNPTGATNPCAAALDGDTNAFARFSGSSYQSYYSGGANANAYVGFMYGTVNASSYEAEHSNTNRSSALNNLRTWYDNVFSQSDKNKLADVIWCNDKRPLADTTYYHSSWQNSGLGYGNNPTVYAAEIRLLSSFTPKPDLSCGTSIDDNKISKFTGTDTTYGNGALSGYKIGLLTADELAFAGSIKGTVDSSMYLIKNTGSSWWTMTPYYFSTGNMPMIFMVFVMQNGTIGNNGLSLGTLGLRPAIALKSDVTATGTGTQADPFVVN